ncbi:hypothetical protein G6O69_11490 [Pseudenhygromyxa sp. WMMC2535]|uniref:hypothetical protein n=1 Tax=Pseudenhygromyxa sp. WMMC2535 TaxID=2712867 RepID=UPI001551AE4E|nr:hypothetical protein [Pseudenhygromyxa sp. WMMC2535]NVB38456.1 hypothetical protein [Pseudenhygromyxa sp. WMMC2535]
MCKSFESITARGALLLLAAPLTLALGCAQDPDAASADIELRGIAANEGYVVEGQIADGGWEGVCLLYVMREDHSWAALAVERNFDDGPPYCGAVEPYLDRIDVIVGWDTADISAVTDTNLLQNWSATYDQPRNREVDYYWLNGPLSADFWGTVYGNIEQSSILGLGICAYYLENDDGEPYALLEYEDTYGACPVLDQIPSGATIRVPLDDMLEVDDPIMGSILDQTFFSGGAEHYVFLASAPSTI